MIKVEGLSKCYQLGHIVSHKNLSNPMRRVWQRLMGQTVTEAPAEAFWALKDVSFEVQQGEVVGIIGKNGAGKSTLLKILSRITDPSEGRIELNGRVASLLEVGTGFNPELTGRENIFLNGAILGMSRREIQSRFDEIIAFAEVEKFLDTPVKRYSSGMYVRLAFAVAAHLEPDILIVDEVLAVGDSEFQRKCLGKIKNVSYDGRTVLFVSHNMAAISDLCKRVILLEDGCKIADASSDEAIKQYQNGAKDYAFSGYAWECKNEGIDAKCHDSIIIKKIAILSIGGKTLSSIFSGDGILIRIRYKVNENIVAPSFNVIVRTMLGVEVFRLNTMPISGYEIESLGQEGYVDLKIDSLPVTAGLFTLDVGVARERIEWIVLHENVINFEVSPKDVYNSGMALDSTKGMIVLPHSWSHNICK